MLGVQVLGESMTELFCMEDLDLSSSLAGFIIAEDEIEEHSRNQAASILAQAVCGFSRLRRIVLAK